MGLSFRAGFNRDWFDPAKNTVRVAVGYSSKPHYSGMSTAELAEKLTFGTDKIPARPHIEEGLEEGEYYIQDVIASYLRKHPSRRDASEIGEAMVNAIRAYIFSGALAPNAERTIKKKHSDQPLIDTGDLIDDLEYEVLRGRHG